MPSSSSEREIPPILTDLRLSVNVIGYHFMSAAFLPLLGKATEKNHGFSSSIVNISSISGQLKVSQHHMPYNASKAAAIQLTEMFAVHCAEAGTKVRVNSIAPGVFPSGMTTDGVDEDQKSSIDASGYREKKGVSLSFILLFERSLHSLTISVAVVSIRRFPLVDLEKKKIWQLLFSVVPQTNT